jgi:hypothetical protein
MSPVPMPMVTAAHDDAARWQAWERSYMNSSRRAAFHARVAFTILLTGAAAWLGVQLLSMPV